MNKKLSILSLILAMLFVSCKNPLNFKQESKESQKAYISISANLPGSNARTVLPNAVTARTTGLTWELKGKNEGSENEKTLKTWSDTEEQNAYDNMCSDTNILLDVGNWQFTLTVSNTEGKVLEATLGDENNPIQITKDGENKLEFVMQEATGENLANGQIEFTLKFPPNVVGQVEATLNKITISEDNEILEEPFDSFEWEWIKGNYFSEVTYNYPREGVEKTLLPSSYKLIIKLQQQNGNQDLQTINTYSCIIRVAPGLLSSGSYELERLTQLYSITYGYKNLESGLEYTLNEFVEGNITTTFDEFTEFVLPTPIVPAGYEDYEFDAWYTDSTYADDKRIESTTYQISGPTTLYAKWKLKEEVVLPYAIATKQWKDDNGGLQTEQITEAIQTTDESIKITAGKDIEQNPSDVWTYFISAKPNQNSQGYIFYEGNNTVTLQLKSDSETVVGVAAARADMFFTVGTEWKTYTFETGYLAETMTKDITIGAALSDTPIYLRNIKVERIENSTKENSLPTLSFNINNDGITSYLNGTDKVVNIIGVEKTESNDGYQITLNTDVSNVDLTIRDYATPGLNKTSFNISFANTSDTLQTAMIGASVDANGYKNNPKVVAWTTATEIPESGNLAVYFPAYANNEDETLVPCAIEGILSGGNVSSTMTIKDFKIEAIESLEDTGKVFAIKTQNSENANNWQPATELPFDQTMTIPAQTTYYFDVLIVDSFEDSSKINWSDCTRFLYSTSAETTSDGKFYYSAGKENNNDVFKITNNTNESCTCKITLTEDFTVQIEEVTTTGGTTGEGATSTDPSDKNSGLAYFTKSDGNGGNISCLYIYDAEGLGLYRDLVNGTLANDLTFTKNGYAIGSISTLCTGRVDAYLADDITVSNWVPISKEDVSFFEFDGQRYSITINSIDSNYSGDYFGLFGKVGNGNAENLVIKNLAVKGGSVIETTAKYAGGIVAYAKGITLENCINFIDIKLTSDNDGDYCGGLVGYCESGLNISRCINAGEISCNIYSLKYYGGIVGQCTSGTISDCINLGKIATIGTGEGAGIAYGAGSVNITNCINTNVVSAPIDYAISDTNGSITNCYYNSEIFTNTPDDNLKGIISNTTSELCALTKNELSENWSCVIDGTRYPLPDILGADENSGVSQSIWEEICYAAKVEVSSGGGEDEIAVVSSFENLKSTIESITDTYTKDNPYVIGIENGFSTEISSPSSIEIKSHIKLIAMNSEGCTITKTNDYASINIFKVNSGASLTLGDENAVGEIIIDGQQIESSKSLINVSGTLVLNENSILQNSYIKDTTNGGAVYSKAGTIEIHGGIVQNNNINASGKYGGAIYLDSGTFTMTSGTFNENSCNAASGYVYGGALYLSYCAVEITGGEFSNNIVSESTGSYGGAIYILTSSSDSEAAVISNCTFESNTAYQSGGAIYTGGTGNVEIKKCNFKNNTVSNSTANGGAIYVGNSDGSVSVNECMFDGNTSPAIAKTQSSMVFTVDGEEVNSGEWDPSSSSEEISSWNELKTSVEKASEGDVIYVTGQFDVTEPITISKNITIETKSGANFVLNETSFTTNNIYGIFNITNGKLTLIGANNECRIIIDGSSEAGYISNTVRLINVISSGSLETNYVTLQNLNGTDSFAAGIFFNNSTGTLDVVNTKITKINGKQGAGICVNNAQSIEIKNSSIENCMATSQGGALYVYGQANCIISETTLSQNSVDGTSGFGGGAISISSTNATVYLNNNCNIVNNSTNKNGGGILIDSGNLYINSATIKDNTCDGQGKNIFSTTDSAGNHGNVYIKEVIQESTIYDAEISVS